MTAPTVGVAFPGDARSRQTWSGITSGVVRGLESHDVAVQAVDVSVPSMLGVPLRAAVGLLRRERAYLSELTPEYTGLQSLVARWVMRRRRDVDGVVQIGAGYLLPRGTPVVTLEDMTVKLALERYPAWQRLPAGIVQGRVDRQRQAYERAVACCVTSRWAARSVVEDYGIPPEKVHVVGVGRNLDVRPVDRAWYPPRYLFVGVEWERKNGPAVLRAFERVRHDHPDARLDVVGNHPPLTAAGVAGHGVLRLDVPEHRSRLEALFASATCYVMPSWVEPFGIAYVEAAATGLPLIGTTEGGSSDIVGDGGRVVPPGDQDALVAAMAAFAEPAVAQATGLRAQRRSALFTWPLVAGRLLRALELPAGASASGPAFLEHALD